MEEKVKAPRGFVTKYDMAQLYFKGTHGVSSQNVSRLMRKIKRNEELSELLVTKANYNKSERHFTPSQVELIYDYLEEPI